MACSQLPSALWAKVLRRVFSTTEPKEETTVCDVLCIRTDKHGIPRKKLCKIISSKVKHLKNTPKTPHFGGFIPQPHIHQAAPGESPPAARARWARSAMRCGRPGWPQSRRAWHEPSLPHQQRRGRQLPRPHHGHNLG